MSARRVRPVLLASLLLACPVLAACGGSDDEAAVQDPADLWGRELGASEVTEGGESRPFLEGTRLRVTLEGEGERGTLGWHAGCNRHSDELEATSERLLVEPGAATLIGCPPALQAQDERLSELFASDPTWTLDADELALTSDDTSLRLVSASP